jgi:predicted nucleic acid-binding protein
MGLMQDIGSGPLALDTVTFIYFIEEHEQFLPIVEPVFAAIDDGTLEGVTSAVTLLEVLVVPYRAGDAALAQRYETILTRSRGLQLVDLDRAQLRAAAQLRAVTSSKTPDALQIAAALATGCKVLLTNDRHLHAPGLRVLQLRDYLGR